MTDDSRAPAIVPETPGRHWIDQLTDEQCMEIFWLYVDPPEPFLARFPPALLGAAMRHALKEIAGGAPRPALPDPRA